MCPSVAPCATSWWLPTMRNLFARQPNGMRWAPPFVSLAHIPGMGRGWWIWNKKRNSVGTVGSEGFWGRCEKYLIPVLPVGPVDPTEQCVSPYLLGHGEARVFQGRSWGSLGSSQGPQSNCYLSLSLEVFQYLNNWNRMWVPNGFQLWIQPLSGLMMWPFL